MIGITFTNNVFVQCGKDICYIIGCCYSFLHFYLHALHCVSEVNETRTEKNTDARIEGSKAIRKSILWQENELEELRDGNNVPSSLIKD